MNRRRKASRRIGALLRGLLLWPFAGIVTAANVRFATISNPGRIGHMAAEIDCFLKERALGLIPRENAILFINSDKAANRALLDIFRQYIPVWSAPFLVKLLSELVKFTALRQPLGRPVVGLGESARYHEINWLWGDRPPAVALTPEIERDGRACLARLGVPDGGWFVCAHAREGGYSPRDEHDHAHRNASIGTYGGAFDAVREAGGWVVRVGDPTMTPLEPGDRIIDYATSPHKSDWMDLWLMARCRFMVGTSSGLAMLATMFGRPCALANMIPVGAAFGMGLQDISIPKRMIRNGDEIPLPQAFAEDLDTIRYAGVFEEKGVSLVENTGDEIRALVREMLSRLEGTFEETTDDRDLQRRYKALMKPNDYCYGAVGHIGRDWLRENRHLLGD